MGFPLEIFAWLIMAVNKFIKIKLVGKNQNLLPIFNQIIKPLSCSYLFYLKYLNFSQISALNMHQAQATPHQAYPAKSDNIQPCIQQTHHAYTQ